MGLNHRMNFHSTFTNESFRNTNKFRFGTPTKTFLFRTIIGLVFSSLLKFYTRYISSLHHLYLSVIQTSILIFSHGARLHAPESTNQAGLIRWTYKKLMASIISRIIYHQLRKHFTQCYKVIYICP